MPGTNENLKRDTGVSSIQRTPRRNEGKLFQLERRIKMLEYQNHQLKADLKDQQRINIL